MIIRNFKEGSQGAVDRSKSDSSKIRTRGQYGPCKALRRASQTTCNAQRPGRRLCNGVPEKEPILPELKKEEQEPTRNKGSLPSLRSSLLAAALIYTGGGAGNGGNFGQFGDGGGGDGHSGGNPTCELAAADEE